jgi:hypothetical protein
VVFLFVDGIYHGPLDRWWRRKMVGILPHPYNRIIVVNVLKELIFSVKIGHLNHIAE